MFRMSGQNVIDIICAAGCGATLSAFGYLFTKHMDAPKIDTRLSKFEFLIKSESLCDNVNDLLTRLTLNGLNAKVDLAFENLCANLNLLAGYDILVNRDAPIALHSNYAIQKLLTDNSRFMLAILEQKFHIPTLGSEICDLVESLETLSKDIAHNVNYHIRSSKIVM